jgi:hypothetical protein
MIKDVVIFILISILIFSLPFIMLFKLLTKGKKGAIEVLVSFAGGVIDGAMKMEEKWDEKL